MALVEFALALPLLIVITMYGLEIAWVAIQQQKVNQIAAVTADNAARVRATIDETDVTELMTAARMAGEQMKFVENGRLILSSVQLNDAKNGQWIRWQRCEGDLKVAGIKIASKYGNQDKGKSDTSLQGVGPGNALKAPSGNAIMLVEIHYNYQPLISEKFSGTRMLKSETAYLVRDRTDLSITNTAHLTPTEMKTC